MLCSALAIALTIGRVLRRPIKVVGSKRRHVPGPLPEHLPNHTVCKSETVLNGIAAAIERALKADTAIGVARDLVLLAVRFVGHCPEFFCGERRLRNQVSLFVHPRAMR